MSKKIHIIHKNFHIIVPILIMLAVVGFVLIKSQKLPLIDSAGQTGQLSTSVCDIANGPFSENITNAYYPLPVGSVRIFQDETEKVQRSVFDQTADISGVTTRVVEEREWKDGNLVEVSRNFFAQATDGTVCYFGEEVDIYDNGRITGHEGAWKAGEGQNKAGIIMPAKPLKNQQYQQEIAPGIASDSAAHIRFDPMYTVKAGTFNNVLVVEETPQSSKWYAPGVGMINDDGLELQAK